MLPKHLSKVFITIAILALSGCSTPYLSFSNDTLALYESNKTVASVKGQIIYKKNVKLVNINIEQYVYKLDNTSRVLVVEELSTMPTYKFYGSLDKTIWIGFENYIYKNIYRKADVVFYELTNKQTQKKLYLIAQNFNKKRIKLVYGMSHQSFDAIIASLKKQKAIEIQGTPQSSYSAQQDSQSYIQTSWSHKNIILDSLIYKEGGSFRKGV